MTATQLATWCRRLAGYTDTDNYPDAELLDDINLVKDDLASRISKIRPDYFQSLKLLTASSGARNVDVPNVVMNNIAGLTFRQTGGNWKVCTFVPFEQLDFDYGDEDEIIKRYSNDYPYYYIRGNTIFLLSGSLDLTANSFFRLWVNYFPVNLASLVGTVELSDKPTHSSTPGTDSPSGIPKEFHMIWARLVAMNYKDRNSIALSEKDKIVYQELEQKLDEFKEANLEEVFTTSSPDDGSDNGFDY